MKIFFITLTLVNNADLFLYKLLSRNYFIASILHLISSPISFGPLGEGGGDLGDALAAVYVRTSN